MIKIICIGKLKEKPLIDLENIYIKRLNKYTKLEIIELLSDDDKDINKAINKEKEKILKVLKPNDNIVILDINGLSKSSIEFSKFINDEIAYKSNITFIIGSSNGLASEIKTLSNKHISFSKMTFPHQMFRIMLLEQIYRAFKIINNETYHK